MTQCAGALVLAVLALPAHAAAQTGSVEIWMKAFIPGSPSNQGSECARVETKFSLNPTGPRTAVVRLAPAATQGDCDESNSIGAPVVRDGVAQVAGQVSAGDINYSFDLKWRPFPGELTALVSVVRFPAFEMYARTTGREWVEVVRTLPTGSAADAKFTQLSESLTLPVLDGTWETDDAQRRFLLRVDGTSVVWTERDAAGGELTRQVPLWFGDDAATISRANDVEVLTFLGFQPELQGQMLAQSPIPSFITLRIDEQGLLAEWFGVLAIKDRRDGLKALVQPGERPPKRFWLRPADDQPSRNRRPP